MTTNPEHPTPDSPAPTDDAAICWKRNLFFVWLSQFLSLTGFCFCLPFTAYYLQADLGVTDADGVKFWSAVSMAASALAFTIMSPIWGRLADRYGRKLMMLRANGAAMFILYAMGSFPILWVFILLRLLQGVFTGTIAAAQTLVSVTTPSERHGLALGTLSTAMYSGIMAGMFLGGFCADLYGFANAFRIGGGILLFSTLVVLFGVRERFVPPARPATVSERRFFRPKAVGAGLPLLVVLLAASFARLITGPIMPLLIQELKGTLEGAASINGQLGAVACIAAVIAGPLMGRLADRKMATVLGSVCALGAMAGTTAVGLSDGFAQLFLAAAFTAFFASGLDPIFQVWLSRITDPNRRGMIFGLAASAKSLSWVFAPMAGAGVSMLFDSLRVVFFARAGLFLLLIPCIAWASRQVQRIQQKNGEIPAAVSTPS